MDLRTVLLQSIPAVVVVAYLAAGGSAVVGALVVAAAGAVLWSLGSLVTARLRH